MKRYLTDQEQLHLLQAARCTACPLAQRDYWWMRLLIETGARVDEFARISAVQAEAALASGWLVVKAEQRKGGKRGHEYLVTHSVRECLQALLAAQRTVPVPTDLEGPAPLIWGRDGARFSVRSYQARLAHWAQAAGLGLKVSPHWMRHTRGVNIIRRSGSANPLKVVQQALGHASISSSGIYTQMLREDYVRDLHRVDTARMSKRAAVAAAGAAS